MTVARPHLTQPGWIGADFRDVPQAIRMVGRALREALFKPGHPLRYALQSVPVQGKDQGDANTRERAMYRQRFEVCCALLLKLVRHTDIQTNIVCRADDGDIKGLKMATIAEELGLDDRTLARGMHDLHTCGFIVSKRRAASKDDGGFSGRTSVRMLSQSVISLLDLATQWREAGRKAYERAKDKGDMARKLARDLLQKGQAFAAGQKPAARPAPGYYAPLPAKGIGDALKHFQRPPRPA